MIDKESIIEHLRELEEATSDWERYKKISLDELHSDRDKKNMVLHALLVSIQSALDIGNHIIAEHSLKRPSTYRETFEILSEEGLIPKKLGNDLADLAGFRNVITHIYWRMDLDEVYAVLQKDLIIIKSFGEIVKRMLKNE